MLRARVKNKEKKIQIYILCAQSQQLEAYEQTHSLFNDSMKVVLV